MLVAFIFWVDFQKVELFRPVFLMPYKMCHSSCKGTNKLCRCHACLFFPKRKNSKSFLQLALVSFWLFFVALNCLIPINTWICHQFLFNVLTGHCLLSSLTILLMFLSHISMWPTDKLFKLIYGFLVSFWGRCLFC